MNIDAYVSFPHNRWQQPTKENTAGFLHEHPPKGRGFAPMSQGYIDTRAGLLNDRPRMHNCFESPAEVLAR